MIFLWRRRATTPRFTRAMAQSSSEIGQHAVQTARLLGTNKVRLPQVALPLGRLLGEDVATVGVAGLVLAGGGLAEPLGRPPVGLDLGHCCVLGGICHWYGRRPAVLPCDCVARHDESPRFPSMPLPVDKSLNP